MVRLKDRYLLVNIIYTDVPPGQAKGAVPDLLLYNQPTTGELRPQLLLKGIRSEVAALFGDCGAGAIDRSLQGNFFIFLFTSILAEVTNNSPQSNTSPPPPRPSSCASRAPTTASCGPPWPS
jgi:ribonuclease P/MRP protein subunit POP5